MSTNKYMVQAKKDLVEVGICLAGLAVASIAALCLATSISNPELTQMQVLFSVIGI